jgi:hypothetical protein
MEIVECTQRRLVLRKSGRTIRLFLSAGVGMLLIGCLFSYEMVRTASVRCVREHASLTCDVTEKLLGVIPLAEQRFEDVKGAGTGITGDSSDPSYRVELEIEGGGARPLSDLMVSEWQCDSFVERFNVFARSQQRAANFLQLPAVLGFVVLPGLFCAAWFFLALARPYRLEIDRERGRLSIAEGITKKASYPLADVLDVHVEESKEDDQIVRKVFLLLKGGERLRLLVEPDVVALLGDYVSRRSS